MARRPHVRLTVMVANPVEGCADVDTAVAAVTYDVDTAVAEVTSDVDTAVATTSDVDHGLTPFDALPLVE